MKKRFFYFIFCLLLFFSTVGNSNVILANTATDTSKLDKVNAEVEKAFKLLKEIKDNNRFVKNLDSLTVIDLPVGISASTDKEGENYTISISDLIIRDGKAYINAYMAFTIPGSEKQIAFKGTDIPFSFSGGIPGASLQLVSDFDVDLTNDISLVLKGNGKTYVTFDCSGFKEMKVSADVNFSSSVFVPEKEDGTLLEGEKLTASFETVISNWNNMLIGLSLSPFQFKPLKGVGFKITNAVFDMSDFANPSNIVFPEKYATDYFSGTDRNIWRGFYIQEAEIRMPSEFKKDGSTDRRTFYAHNMLIDELGFTAKLEAKNLLTLDEGQLGEWKFSVLDLKVDIQTSQIASGSFSGQIHVPVFKDSSVFNYQASIAGGGNYAFSVTTTSNMEFSLWAAKITIAPNSNMSIVVKDGKFLPSLYLNGDIAISASVNKDDANSKKLTIAEVPFQGMRIQTIDPYFSVESISFGMKQNLFSNFPVSITEIGFEKAGTRYGVKLGLSVNFTGENDGGFAGEGVFTVWGKYENKKFKYDGVEVDKIAVDISKPGAFELKGEILFIRGDSIYGDGFKGTLSANFAGFGMDATALFGNVKGYRYWYADAMLTLAAGLPLGPISVYGFGGGVYHHMKQAGVDANQKSEIGKSRSGITYIPDKNSGLGIMASVKFGLSGSASAFNGDVKFEISFTTAGGLNQIAFEGNAYFVTGDFGISQSGILENAKAIAGKAGQTLDIPKDAQKSQLYGNIKMLFDYPNHSFHSTFSIYVNVLGGIIKGVGDGGLAGWGVVHFAPGDWYIHLGTPTKPNGISVLGLAQMTNYFMCGSSVPELPDPPKEVTECLSQKGTPYPNQRTTTNLGDGKGLALGAAFKFDTGERSFLMFYGRFGCGLGFDILLKQYRDAVCEGSTGTLGINGWYAQGQAYAWVAASVGIKVDLPFYSGKYSIFDIQVAALLRAKAPNPFWMKGEVGGKYNILGGLVKGRCSFEFTIGEECRILTGSPFGGLPVIAEVKPSDGESEVTVFNTPQAVFNMPVDEVIEFKDENKVNHEYKIKLHKFSVNTEAGIPIIGTISWNDRNDVVAFKSKDILPGETKIKIVAEAAFQEKRNGIWFDLTRNGSVITEKKEITFNTGKEPDIIPQENVTYSYPQYRCYNYYQSESNGNYIKLNMGQPKLFQPGSEWVQRAKLTLVTGGQPYYTTFSYDGPNNQISMALPQNMVNSSIYKLELVNVPANAATKVDANVKQKTQNVVLDPAAEIETTTNYAEGERKELAEKVIYTMEFRSSQYNTFASKIRGLQYSEGISWELYPLVHSLTVNILGERFDNYEVINLNDQTQITCEPALNETSWYNNKIQPMVNIDNATLSSIGATTFTMPSLTSYFFQSDGTRRLTDSEATTGVVTEGSVYSGLKLYLAKYADEYISSLKNKIANKYAGSPIPNAKLQTLFNSQMPPLAYGNYPVNLKYKLPGKTETNSTVKYQIEYKD